ncbi:MAG: hypothetical protein ACFCU6_03345 [Balneolaceae bacterium]
MGQQQLLLVILITILVGIATIVAINTMQVTHEEQNRDAIRQDIMQAHNMAKAYYLKPRVVGGGGESFENVTLQLIALPEKNENAEYEITNRSTDSFEITARARVIDEEIKAIITKDNIQWVDNNG